MADDGHASLLRGLARVVDRNEMVQRRPPPQGLGGVLEPRGHKGRSLRCERPRLCLEPAENSQRVNLTRKPRNRGGAVGVPPGFIFSVLMPLPRTALLAILAVAAGVLAGCDELPRDPEGTTERVTGSVLRVGWIAGAEPTEVERAAVEGLAARLDAAVEAAEGTAHEFAAELDEGKVHLVGGGLPENTPFASDIGLSKPVGTIVLRGEAQPTVMAVRSGENRFLLLLNEAIEKAKR